ncbi:UxaA family hydrolase [Teredinibacter sp. KSP-S5-2]|uniref:UxaA family hydrolase n=1 Tax=Teredinibacter sp. KSP-S5-2 TaxID=3034506 RepID=UPI002935294E|nr:UxaA family hydrolase [Teredinibacter sp. KSP-S5-2]WNO07861.1 UxaA family hydrolase [Teredinibacter sp. KSP-S5-2]
MNVSLYSSPADARLFGYRRLHGGVGFRNLFLVVAVAPCVEGYLRKLTYSTTVKFISHREQCTSSPEFVSQLGGMLSSGNVMGLHLVSMGCESIEIDKLEGIALALGIDVQRSSVQSSGSVDQLIFGISKHIHSFERSIQKLEREAVEWGDVVLGINCGGSDYTNSIVSNPFLGRVVEAIINLGARVIASEPVELIGLESQIKEKCSNDKVFKKIFSKIQQEQEDLLLSGQLNSVMVEGNFSGGLTTIEEKAAGSYSKFSSSIIVDALSVERGYAEKVGNKPGVYFQLGTHQEPQVITLMSAAGAQGVLFSTGRGGVFNHPFCPVFSFCGNKETCKSMKGMFDFPVVFEDLHSTESLDRAIGMIAEWLSGIESISESNCLDSFDFYYKR